MVGERWCRRVQVDPHEPGENRAAHFFQVDLAARAAARKILDTRHERQLAIGLESPSVIGAGDALGVALLFVHQAFPAVRADVVERADATIVAAGDEDRFAPDLVSEEIAGVRHLFSQPADQPGFGPDAIQFSLHEFARPIAFAQNGPAG